MSAIRDAVVIGGGLAGAGIAIELARAGRDVAVIEREARAHDKVCGEFLSGEALGDLCALGLDPYALGAVPIRSVSLSHKAAISRRVLPFAAASLSRRTLDEALLARAVRAGAMVLRGAAARSLRREGGLWRVELDGGGAVVAREAVLATGKHDLRGWARPAGRQDDLIGLKRHFRLTSSAMARLGDSVALGLFPGGYAGLEPVEGGRANLCLLVRERAFAELGRDWTRLTDALAEAAPEIGASLEDATPLGGRPLAIARTPYGLVRAEAADGVWRLGDQAVVIPSFAGEGMSIALRSARLAASDMLAGHDAAAFQARFARDVRRQVRLATAISQGLVRGPVQAATARAAALFPPALSRVAAATRLAA